MFTFDHVFSNNKKTTITLFRLLGQELLRKPFVFKFYNRAASGAMKLVLTEYLTKVLKLFPLSRKIIREMCAPGADENGYIIVSMSNI